MINGLEELDKICDRIYNLDDVDYTKPMYFNDIWTDILKMLYTAKISESIHDTLPKSIERVERFADYSINYINRCTSDKELGVMKRDFIVKLECIKDALYGSFRSINHLYDINDPKLIIHLMIIWNDIAALRETHYILKSIIERIERRNNK